MNLGTKPVTYIRCLQCGVTLYRGESKEEGEGHCWVHWHPLMTGSWRPPKQPPKRCPRCEGSTIQEGRPT